MKPRPGYVASRSPAYRHPPRFPLHFNLRKAMFVLPNLFTISSIFCGFYAVVLVSSHPGAAALYKAALAVFFGIFFDMADGRVARLTRTQSAFGTQMDSLADMITFGLAPGIIVHRWALAPLGLAGALLAFIYVACGALRLARFNVLATRSVKASQKFFIGLPIPLAAGVLMSLVMFHQRAAITAPVRQSLALKWMVGWILALMVLLSYLMVSNVRYHTFKEVKISAKSLAVFVSTVLIFALTAVQIQPAFALVVFFATYTAIGPIEAVVFSRRRRKTSQSLPPPPVPESAHPSQPHPSQPHPSKKDAI